MRRIGRPRSKMRGGAYKLEFYLRGSQAYVKLVSAEIHH